MKTILITGGSKGIGNQIVRLALKKNYRVIFTYCKSLAEAKKLVKLSKNCFGIKVNLENPKDRLKVIHFLKKERIKINYLINNAAFDVKRKKFEKITQNEVKKIFEINVFAIYDLIRMCLPFFEKKKNWNSIINFSSTAAKFGGNNFSHYAPTKAAIENLTIGLSKEFSEKKIRVNSIAPGIINNKLQNRKNKTILESIPSKRLGTTRDVANLVMWILSDEAEYINGSNITISGGR